MRREGDGVAGVTADGIRVTLDVRRVPCTDAMSGEAHDAVVRLRVDDRDYDGCGRLLAR